ncbi:MAG: SDR family oxidoreductase [Chloroflexota bacterium]|nr:SDR family oxidoreductase [Chloroflexota bacterium]MDE2935324.1 SDR family oxidoreductase [Chloroflexota bacterium]MXY12909.1 SDR family oxidoreductase [Chloroflexota bacterium]
MDLHLAGKRALVTGASQGIGEGLAEAFAREGVNLVLVARNEVRLLAVKTRLIDSYGVAVEVCPGDLTTEETIDTVASVAGDVDILVNNAGSIPGGNLESVDEASWREGWDLKVYGYINLTRAIYPNMRDRGGGVIINNIGNAGQVYDPDYVAGTSGNASLMAFTRALGGRSLDDGIRVVGVNPGPVETERIYKLLRRRALDLYGDESQFTKLLERYPLKRPATVPEVVDLMVFLASDRSGYTSGTIVTVDGGISSRHSII